MNLDYVKKRDGKKVKFKSEKIKNAVAKAAAAVEQADQQIAVEITAEVLSYLKIFFKSGGTVEVEQIQDLVEKVLIEKGYAEIAKAYILYREQHSKLRDSKKLFADAVNIMDDYLDRSDWKVNENSNMSYSLQGLNNYIASEVTGQYWLQEIYPKETAELHSSGDLHIHDLGNLSVYCCGWDLEELLRSGFRGVPSKIESAPPKHLKTALGQIVNFMYTLQGECYSSDTEVLTKEGWKYFYELNKRDKVCTLNPETDRIEYQKPLRYIEKDHKGKMLHFNQRSLDMMVTPDHKLLVEQYAPHTEDNYYKKFVLAKNFNPNSNFIPKQGKWEGEVKKYFILPPLKTEVYHYFGDNYVEKILEVPKIKMNNWLAFFGFWIAEGSIYERKRKMKNRSNYSEYIINISQNENQNADDFKKLLNKLPFEFHISRNRKINGPDKLNFRINSKQLYNYLKKFGHAGDKYIPEKIKNLDSSQLEILFNWMMKGDGYIGNGNYEYYTKSKKLADDVQEIMTKLGYCANIYIKTKGKFKWYVISRLATKMHKVAAKNINKIEYSGKVYCVEVPNQTLLVRRNGKSVWGGNCAGAQAFSNFDTYLAPFIAYDGLNYQEVKQAMQEFLFNMNVPTRVGFQTPFTNITMDLEVPNYLKDQAVIIGGQYQEKCYGEFQQEMDMLNRAFAELMMEGDAKGRMFSFPIPTYNITEDFEWENEKLDPVWEMTAKFGIPYFSNYINSDMDPEDARSMCCRLRLSNKELRKRGGGLFGANPLTGSLGVITLNMPRIGYQAQTKKEFMERVYYLMDQAKESLEVKRRVLETLTEQGLYPYAKFYLRDIKKRFDQYWKNHFNTIGLNGMNEALLNFMDKDISTPAGQQFSEEIMKKMRERLQQYQEETDNLYNLEATPAESTAYRFARLDREKFGNQIIAANQERVVKEDADPYYTNSTQLPVGLTDDIFTALELQDELQSLYTGGTVLHGFLGEKIDSIAATKKLVKRIAENFKLPYYTLTPSFSICPVHGYLSGEHEYCPKCEAEAEAEEKNREKLKAESEVE